MTYCNTIVEHFAHIEGGFSVDEDLDVHYAAGVSGSRQMMYGLRTTFCRHRLQDSSRRVGAFAAREKCGVGAGDLNPHGRLSPADFHTVYGFRRPDVSCLKADAMFTSGKWDSDSIVNGH